jgi:DNA-binding beta-propeller fold protein YncE
VRSTFATGLNAPIGLAFNTAGNLFVANQGDGTIDEITPGGIKNTFTSGLLFPEYLAFQGVTLPVPEPSAWGLFAAGFAALFICNSRNLCR